MSPVLFAVLMLVGVVAAFAIVHSLTRKIPFTDTVPRERFRWPVWNWYPLVVIGALVTTLGFAIYYEARDGDRRSADDLVDANDSEAEATDFELVAGKDKKPGTTSTSGAMTTGTPESKTK